MKMRFMLCMLLSLISCGPGKIMQAMAVTKTEVILRDAAYSKLSDKVTEYRMALSDAELKFKKAAYQFNIPFFKVSSVFDNEDGDAQDGIYASLGYDFNIIKKLEMLFSKLDLQDPPTDNEDTAVAIKLLDLLKDATDSVKVILNEHLSESRLTKIIASKGEGVITKINFLLDEVMRIRYDVTLKIIKEIERVQAKMNNDPDVLDKLSNIFAESGEIKHSVNFINNVASQIESLTRPFA
ncbi:Hypothetical protein BHY_1043 (plasmid) [Borrelia nietonii YOR]|uniref:Lipoprotein n=2 Tax=Borrelia TaxID=138 RepID=W5SA60_9SPIR|nr:MULTISPECIES: hypothetical protein [Borrelia]AHH03994.1 Hypothetical protein BHY_1043 [Borrelia nietonii YOR]AHH14561.1 Hypothetical protein BHW_0023300 [Borrelia hermsii MTW]UPA09831.1 hypothetical protein bhYOR_001138 [Borrelia nietonii YOR]